MVGKVFYMMTEMEQAVETLLGLRRQIESQLDNMVVDVIAGDTDKGYLDRKKDTLQRKIDSEFYILYKILKLDDQVDSGNRK